MIKSGWHTVILAIFLLCFLISPFTLFSHTLLEIYITTKKNPSILKDEKSIKDTSEVAAYLNNYIKKIAKEGKNDVSIDSIIYRNERVLAYIYISSKLTLASVDIVEEQKVWLRDAGINLKKFIGKPVTQKLLDRLLQSFVVYNENNGYPFASAKFINIEINGDSLYTKLDLNRGEHIVIDTLILKGDARLRPKFIQHHLFFKKGMPYSEEYVNAIDNNIESLGFTSLYQPSAIEFLSNSARLYTYIGNRKINTAQGILAFGNDDNGKFQLQGEVQLQLHNLFKGGEKFALNWQSPGNSSQILHIHASVPYLIFGMLGVAASFDIDKRDSLYINTGGQVGLNTRIGNIGKASLYISMHRNSNTSGIEKNTKVNLTKYGINYEYTKYDNYLVPRKGLNLTLDISAGTRKVAGSTSTSSKNGGSIEALLHASYLQPLSNLIGLQLKIQGKAKELFSNSEKLFLSELYTIGGTYTLRGFNERSIFASSYVIATIEPRLYYGSNSYLLAFFDYAIAQSKYISSNNTNQLFSFGIGTQFETRAGIFNITYALGKDFDNSISFRDSKIHLGYKAVF